MKRALYFQPPFVGTPEFADWTKRAATARKKLLESNPPYTFNEKIWKDFKNEFLVPLGRCMYCEGRYAGGHFDDAEHYRPKNSVTENRIEVHHGYYWLVYEWHNLLLACKKCNSSHPDRWRLQEKASQLGKLCEFPITGKRVTKPSADPDRWEEELEAEGALLLHPYYDPPDKHFVARAGGFIASLSDQGEFTIKVCDLNRKELCDDRLVAEKNVKSKANDLWHKNPMGQLDWEREKYSREDAFATYLNCKVKEEIDRLMKKMSQTFGNASEPPPPGPHPAPRPARRKPRASRLR